MATSWKHSEHGRSVDQEFGGPGWSSKISERSRWFAFSVLERRKRRRKTNEKHEKQRNTIGIFIFGIPLTRTKKNEEIRRDRSGASFRSLTITVCSSISCSSRSCRLQIQEGTWSLLEKPRATRQQPGSPKQQRFHQTNTQRVYQRSSPLPSDNSHFFCIQGTGRLHTFIYNWPQQKEVLQVTTDFCGHKRRTYLEDPCFHASFPPHTRVKIDLVKRTWITCSSFPGFQTWWKEPKTEVDNTGTLAHNWWLKAQK